MYAAESMEREEFRKVRRERIRRRQRARRRMCVCMAVTVLVVFAIGVFFGSLMTDAKGGSEENSYKYYSSVSIASGDSLWSLADTYMDNTHYMTRKDYINEVMEINHMVSDRLVSGQKIILPYYSTELR